jgi:hypothetical protein
MLSASSTSSSLSSTAPDNPFSLPQASRKVDFSKNPMYEKTFEFYDHSLLDDVNRGVLEVQEFFRLLSVCHTVMPEEKDGECSSSFENAFHFPAPPKVAPLEEI